MFGRHSIVSPLLIAGWRYVGGRAFAASPYFRCILFLDGDLTLRITMVSLEGVFGVCLETASSGDPPAGLLHSPEFRPVRSGDA